MAVEVVAVNTVDIDQFAIDQEFTTLDNDRAETNALL